MEKSQAPRTPISVVLVDSNPDESNLLRLAICRADPTIDVVQFDIGSEVLKFFEFATPPEVEAWWSCDLIILDLFLRDMSGLELLRIIRNQYCLNNVPIIVIADRPTEEERMRSLALGAQCYLGKPGRVSEMFLFARTVLSTLHQLGSPDTTGEPFQ